jgi:hypothetical protein
MSIDPQVVNRTPEQAARARANPLPPNLETYAAALTRDEIDNTIVVEWLPFVLPDIKRGNWITSMITDHRVAKHTANTLILYPSLEDQCPRCTQIHIKGHRRFSSEFCVLLSAKGPLPGFLACKYVYCSMLPKHTRIYCPKINLWCFDYLHRGHAASDKVCKAKDANLAIFEEAANLGFVTRNRFRTEGAAAGYYPILTLGQVQHVDNMGGYSRLLAIGGRRRRAPRRRGRPTTYGMGGRGTILHSSGGFEGLSGSSGRCCKRSRGGRRNRGGYHT